MTVGITRMTVDAVEGSTYVIPVAFRDADDSEVTPTIAFWSLYGHDKTTIVNGKQDVTLTGSYIVLTGGDLALPISNQNMRYILIKAVYDSDTFGTDLSFRAEIQFKIVNLGTIDPGT